nr:MAG: glutamate 5-kinase [Hyphomicrobiales bacterium]
MKSDLKEAKRAVIKVGSSLLVDSASGRLRLRWLQSLISDIAELKNAGTEILLVSSGAIALGRRTLDLRPGDLRLEESQAAAAVGQVRLAQAYVDAFHAFGITAAQILVTLEDSEDRRRYLNARETLRTLLDLGAIPVINENDTVATAEIRFGDNDRLAARIAGMTEADHLVLLSDIDGLYTANPQRDDTATHIAQVNAITPEIEAMAEGPLSKISRGGMQSKIAAAKMATSTGARVIIANGHVTNPLQALAGPAKRTLFVPNVTPTAARKRWLAGGLSANGAVVIDGGAAKALLSGKSLLPAGVVSVEGEFERGDVVVVKNAAGSEMARGLVAYSTAEARMLIGRRTVEIEGILGYRGRDEMIHRADLVLTGAHGTTT